MIGLIRHLKPVIPKEALSKIYKSFLSPHLDYGDVIYDHAFNESFQDKLQSVRYNSALGITGAIRGSSRKTFYQELGLELLKSRRWYRKLCLFFKIKIMNIPLTSLKVLSTRVTRIHNSIPLFNVNPFIPGGNKKVTHT